VVFGIACLLALALASSRHHEEKQMFNEFMHKFNKVYSDEQVLHKFRNFQHNIRTLRTLNNALPDAVYNVTKFFDMSPAEFRRYPCGVDKLSELNSKRPGFAPVMNTEPIPHAPLPTDFDWTTKGAVTPIKNQEQCGSCWAFSTIANIEGVHFLAKKKLVSMSEQQLVSCSTTDYGCEGGWPFWALTDMLASPYNGRIDTEKGFPYTSGDGDNGVCNFGTNDIGGVITGYKSYCTEQTPVCKETEMQQLLVTYGPLSVCLDAGPMQYYQGGIDNPTDCDPDAIDHCVSIVGYGVQNGTPFWRIKNSWGTDWGENGFYRLIRGTGACGINKVITIAHSN